MIAAHSLLLFSQASIAGGITLTNGSPKWFPRAQKVENWVKGAIGGGIFLQWAILLNSSNSLDRLKGALLMLPPRVVGLISVLTALGFLTTTAIGARKLLDATLPEEEISESSEKMKVEWGRPLSSLPWLLLAQGVMDLALLAFCRSKALSLLSFSATSLAFWKVSKQRFVKISLEIPAPSKEKEGPQAFRISLLFRDFGWVGKGGECSICTDPLKDKPLLSPCGDPQHAVHRSCAAKYVVRNPEDIASSLIWHREISKRGSVSYSVKLEPGRACQCIYRDPCSKIEILVLDRHRGKENLIAATVEK